MVSMSPNTLHYNFTNKWRNPCLTKDCNDFSTVSREKIKNNLFDILLRDPSLSKTVSIIKMAHLEDYFRTAPGYTLFVTIDEKIPDSFIKTLDSYDARKFILSYTLKSELPLSELRDRGDAVYQSCVSGSPILSILDDKTNKITINKVGIAIRDISSKNGTIIVMDNIADVFY